MSNRFSYARGPLSWGTGSVSASSDPTRAAEVAAAVELGKLGWDVKTGRAGDLIATRPDATSEVHIEVKAAPPSPKDGHQVLLAGAPGQVDAHIFVDVDSDDESTKYWVIPDDVVETVGTEGVLQADDVTSFRAKWDVLDSLDGSPGKG
jgi:hypothetical protein